MGKSTLGKDLIDDSKAQVKASQKAIRKERLSNLSIKVSTLIIIVVTAVITAFVTVQAVGMLDQNINTQVTAQVQSLTSK